MTQPIDILIAEDSRTQLALLQHRLVGRGYQVTATMNGMEALTAARTHRPMLIISDIEMPVMDGYQLCAAIKNDTALRSVPVLLLTSLGDSGDVLRGLDSGADYYLTKPYNPENLLLRVESVLASPPAVTDKVSAEPIEVVLDGKSHRVTATRQQALNLLLSTYADAVGRNKELIQSQANLNRANEELRKAQMQIIQAEKLAALGQLVAGVAHEINNPLAFVMNNVAVIARDVTYISELLGLYQSGDPALIERNPDLHLRIKEYAERIDLPRTISELENLSARSREGLTRIQQIVKNLRDFAQQEAVGDMQDVADLNSGIESTLNIAFGQAAKQGVAIERDLAPLHPITCRPAKINQVILNLIMNAIDACGKGGKITVQSRNVEGGVQFRVIDNGSGIDPAIRDKIFDPFFTTKPQGKGTGLGLSISHGIVVEHGGHIQVDSQPGRGSTFTVFLPLSPPQPPRATDISRA